MDNAKNKQQSGLINIFETLAVFPDPKDIDEAVKKLKAKHSSASGPDLARKIVNSATWKLTGIGLPPKS
jgi:hypothetical protein